VGVDNTKIKVGVGDRVGLAVFVGDGVIDGVKVGGANSAVCVAATAAVCATKRLIAPGNGVGIAS
jgi:hypothetical protein